MTREKEYLSPEDGAYPKQGRTLLHVPARSSSQRNQPSPTASGLSGATVTDSRNSTSDRSKESKSSVMGRTRNGSASSNRSGGETDPADTPVNSQPGTLPAQPRPKKKGGLLALLGCCGVPDNANTLEEENVHKLDRLPQRPTTSKSRQHTPSDHQPSGSKSQLNEKESQQPLASGDGVKDKRVSGTSTQDQSTVGDRGDRESKQSTIKPPSVHVQPPKNGSTADSAEPEQPPVEEAKDEEGDTKMKDVNEEDERATQGGGNDGRADAIPPPPPGPSTTNTHNAAASDAPSEPTKALLPPIRPEHRGRKCLVLDLDETLVHSSFKV